MIVDALVYAGASLYGGGRTLPELLEEARIAGLDRLVAAPAKPADYDLAGASERLAEACAASAGRAVCLARLDPWREDAADSPARPARASGGARPPAASVGGDVRGQLGAGGRRSRPRRRRWGTPSSSRPATRSWPRRSRWPTWPARWTAPS